MENDSLKLPKRKDIEAVTALEAQRSQRMQLVPHNMDIIIVGDFEVDMVIDALWKYIASIPAAVDPKLLQWHGIRFLPPPLPSPLPDYFGKASSHPAGRDFMKIGARVYGEVCHLEGQQERRVMFMALPGIDRYPPAYFQQHLDGDSPDAALQRVIDLGGNDFSSPEGRRMHPTFLTRCSSLFMEVLSNRLFRSIRDSKGLCYSIDANLGDMIAYNITYGTISCTPTPGNEAVTLLE
ncbi:SPP, partial [Symbiodinium sp. KB8]